MARAMAVQDSGRDNQLKTKPNFNDFFAYQSIDTLVIKTLKLIDKHKIKSSKISRRP